MSARWLALSPNTRGAVWMLGATLGFALSATQVKFLAASGIHPFQISLVRALVALTITLPFIFSAPLVQLRTKHPFNHLLRGLAGAIAMLAGFFALSNLPLAEVTALGFTQPLFTIIFAVVLLREKVRWRRWSATAVGFLGMLIMVRPSGEGLSWFYLVAMVTPIGISFAATLIKRFPKTESQVLMILVFCITSILVSGLPALYVWQSPGEEQWLLLIGVGFSSAASHAMFIKAFRTGEATFVAPFGYSKLLIAGAVGFFLFSETPDEWTLAGALVIVGSTLYIAYRERKVPPVLKPSDIANTGSGPG